MTETHKTEPVTGSSLLKTTVVVEVLHAVAHGDVGAIGSAGHRMIAPQAGHFQPTSGIPYRMPHSKYNMELVEDRLGWVLKCNECGRRIWEYAARAGVIEDAAIEAEEHMKEHLAGGQ